MGMDNARIHRANIVKDLMISPDVNIEPIWNLPARPDLLTVGIEQVWAKAKHLYRCAVDRYKALNRPFHHMGLVQNVMGQITDEFAKKVAAHSIPAVMAAEPIQPLPSEDQMGQITEPQYISYSPEQTEQLYYSPMYFQDIDLGFIGEPVEKEEREERSIENEPNAEEEDQE